MKNTFDFLNEFPIDYSGYIITYELFTFDNLFRLFLQAGLTHEEALNQILSKCSLSAYVFQERIHNNNYKLLSAKETLSPLGASRKSKLIKNLLQF